MEKASLKEDVFNLLKRSNEDLAEMEYLFQGNYFYGTANHAYYAMFHAVSALLLSDGKEFSSHQSVISCFGKEYAKSGIVPIEFHRDPIDVYDLRQDVDYDVGTSVSEKQAEEVVLKARVIVQFIEELLIKKYG
jgi:uncharacterized protein (UPF0332 family)